MCHTAARVSWFSRSPSRADGADHTAANLREPSAACPAVLLSNAQTHAKHVEHTHAPTITALTSPRRRGACWGLGSERASARGAGSKTHGAGRSLERKKSRRAVSRMPTPPDMILTPFQYVLTASTICTAHSLDHTVLVVNSLPRTIAFYARLGMVYVPASTAAGPSHALVFGTSRIELREHDPLSPLGPRNGAAEPPDVELEPPSAVFARPGSATVCVIVVEPVSEVKARLERTGIRVLCDGVVVRRAGAGGDLCSIYVRDPDGNVVE